MDPRSGISLVFFQLKKMAKDNVKFLGWQSEQMKSFYLKNCKALIFPQEEDFGISPIEANLFGKPVIWYFRGGG